MSGDMQMCGDAEDTAGYWRQVAMQAIRKKEAATAAARKWRGVAADLKGKIEHWREPWCYRFRGRRGGEVFERDVIRVLYDDLGAALSQRPYLKDWYKMRDGDIVMMLSPSDVTAPLVVDAD